MTRSIARWQTGVPVLLVVGVVLAAIFAITRVEAAQGSAFNPANGHTYEAITVSEDIDWDDAKLAAEALGGYLATVTSEAEKDFIVANFPGALGGPYGYWLGGFQPSGSIVADEDWEWVTGEAFSYTNWDPPEPNDFFGVASEDGLQLWNGNGTWNDLARTSTATGYVVEFEHGKVSICHKGKNITVSKNAVQKHIDKHGDTLGPCN